LRPANGRASVVVHVTSTRHPRTGAARLSLTSPLLSSTLMLFSLLPPLLLLLLLPLLLLLCLELLGLCFDRHGHAFWQHLHRQQLHDAVSSELWMHHLRGKRVRESRRWVARDGAAQYCSLLTAVAGP
jgi:hypothetical protein